MLVREIIENITFAYSKGVPSDDSRLPPRLVYSMLLPTRALLLGQKLKGKAKVSDWNYQTISCVEMIEVTGQNCPCMPPIGCKMLKSKYRLPEPITDYSRDTITFVGTTDGSISFPQTSFNAKRFKKGNKFTARQEDYFIRDGYLFITLKDMNPITVIMVVGLFEDPFEVKNFDKFCPSCEDCLECNSFLDTDFPIDTDLIPTLTGMVLERIYQYFAQSIEDKSNNTSDSIPQQSK